MKQFEPIDKALNLMSFILYSGSYQVGYKCTYPPDLGGGTATGYRLSPGVVEVTLDDPSIGAMPIKLAPGVTSRRRAYLHTNRSSKKEPEPKPTRPGLYLVKPTDPKKE